MKKFKITKEYFKIDGKSQPLISGEIHYFRMDKNLWGKALDKLVEAGCNAVAYYVPWFVHEYEEGKFDFEGLIHPSNNLHDWIKMTEERGLLGILRPGPYVYAETTDLGLPKWFASKYDNSHPLIYKDGKYEKYGLERYASHNNKDFLNCTKKWYSAVMSEVKQYLAPKGNIVMIQLCNEIPGEDNMDENPINLGIGDKSGIFPRYLKEQYADVYGINKQYKTNFSKIEYIEPYMLKEANADLYITEKLRYYYNFYYPEYFKKLKENIGIDDKYVTFIHNAYNPKAISLHYHNKQKNPWLNIGVDCYYSMSGSLNMKNGTYFNDYGAEYSKAMINNPPWVIEQECGYWNDYPQVYGKELYIWNIWTFAAGYKGINMYLFSGGENRENMGFYGTDHNWQAPITKDCKEYHTYRDIKQSITDIKENFEIFSDNNRYDIGFGVKNSYGLIWRDIANITSESYFALKLCGFTPKIYDYEACSIESLLEQQAIWIVTDEYMNHDIQEKLVCFVKKGGKLLLQGCLPYKDENEKKCTILADFLELTPRTYKPGNADQKKLVYKGREYCINQTIQEIDCPNAEILSHCYYEKQPAIIKVKKNGTAIIMPFAIKVLFNSITELINDVLKEQGVEPYIKKAALLRVIPKACGKSVVINCHPVEITEVITIGDITKKLTLNSYSFKII